MTSKSEFVPRVGKFTFPCRFCGKEPMQWLEVAPDTWMPYDLQKREVHNCRSNRSVMTNIHSLMDALNMLGYEAHIPRASTWRVAFSASNASSTIIFLLRKHGVDFRVFEKIEALQFDEEGKLCLGGGHLVRNFYNGSDVNIFEFIFDIAIRFITNCPLDKAMFAGKGKARPRNGTYRTDGASELGDIYSAVSGGGGGAAYLGDGIWIKSDGSSSDNGR